MLFPEHIEDEVSDIRKYLPDLCATLKSALGQNFSEYKESTLIRRYQRRMRLKRISSASDYLQLLKQDKTECKSLFQDLLISVTSFFRDPEAFDQIASRVIPKIFENKDPETPTRIWIPGCATGEEVYSYGIMIHEYLERNHLVRPIQIFATDIDSEALLLARQGRYGTKIESQVTPERLKRFFTREGNEYLIARDLRSMCVFAVQNLITDPPLSSLDLISCRNLLIYIDLEAQKRLVPLFHYCLKPNGFLHLGTSEGLSDQSELFTVIDDKNRIYQHRDVETNYRNRLPTKMDRTSRVPPISSRSTSYNPGLPRSISQIFERVILDDYSPASALVNGMGEILHIAGRAGRFLQPQAGAFSNNILDLTNGQLRQELRVALHNVVQHQHRVTTREIHFKSNDQVHLVQLIVQPVSLSEHQMGLYAVIFEELKPVNFSGDNTAEPSEPSTAEPIIQHLEDELRSTREDLQVAVEELESSNEELTASNEELISTNEEMESANEELRTSHIELEKANRSLLQNQAIMQTVTESIQFGLSMLDLKHRYIFVNQAYKRLLHLENVDLIGKSIYDVFPKHADAIRERLNQAKVGERVYAESSLVEDRVMAIHIGRHKHLDDQDVLIAVIVDITERTKSQSLIRQSEIRLRTTLDNLIEGCQILDFDFRYLYVNESAAKQNRKPAYAILGKTMQESFPGIEETGVYKQIYDTMKNRVPHRLETDFTFEDGYTGTFEVSIEPIPEGIVIFSNDVSLRQEARVALETSEERMRLANESARIGTYDADLSTETVVLSATLSQIAGLGSSERVLTIAKVFELIHPDDKPAFIDLINASLDPAGKGHTNTEFRIIRPTGECRWITCSGQTYFKEINQKMAPYRRLGACMDVTDHRRAQMELHKTTELLQAVAEGTTDAIYVRDLHGNYLFINKSACDQFEIPRSTFDTQGVVDIFQGDSARFILGLDRHVIESGEITEITEELTSTRGIRRIFHSVKAPYRDPEGKIIGVLGISRDITENEQNRQDILAIEERYRASIDHVADSIFLIEAGEHATVIDVNRRACQSLGYSREELIGQHHLLFDPFASSEILAESGNAIKNNQSYEFCSRHLRKDGTSFPVRVRLQPFKLRDNDYVVAIVTDITEELKNQTIKEQYESRMRAAQKTSKLGVWEWDLKSEIWWSDELYVLFGFGPREIKPALGIFSQMLTPQYQELVQGYINATLEHGAPYRFEVPFVDAQKQDKWVYIEGTLEYDEHGKPKKLWGVCQDITDRKKMEEEASTSRAEIAHLSRVASVGEMASSLAHELNQPLTVIMSYAGVTLDVAKKQIHDAESRKLAEHMAEINSQAIRAAEIIRSLRAFIRKQSTQKSSLDINLVVNQSFELVRHELKNASVKHKLILQKNLPAIHADAIQLQQVLVNLVQNAIDAMSSDSQETEKLLTITTSKTDNGVRVVVSDTGKGIAPGEEKSIFKSFYTTKPNGLGLGLPICHSIIESHGGSLRADRNNARGMKFIFDLPAMHITE